VTNAWTEFNVTDTDGTVRIVASKGDLNVTDANGKVTLLEQGQNATLDEQSDQNNNNKKNKKRAAGAVPAAGGGVLNSPIAVGVGAAAIGGVTIWVLTRSTNPVSPATP
jgi:hypothetical protein